MTESQKAKEEFEAAVTEVVGKVGPTIRTVTSVLKDTIQALQPLFADFNQSAKKLAEAARKMSEAKKAEDDVESARAEDARQRSERFP